MTEAPTQKLAGLGNTWDEVAQTLDTLRREALVMGGPAAVQKQHDRGRLTPRERIDLLLDQGSFRELGELVVGTVVVPGRPDRPAPADGIVVGWGTVNGRRVFVLADDGTIAAGARGLAANHKSDVISLLATNSGFPLVWFAESSVNRMQHVMGAQFAGELERPTGMMLPSRANGGRVSPMVVAVSGQSVGRSSFAVTLSEFSTMVRGTSSMALAGGSIVRAAVGRAVTQEELGGAEMHGRITGIVDFIGDSESDSVQAIKRFLGLFPNHSAEPPRRIVSDDPGGRLCPELYDIVPLLYRRAYDMRKVVKVIVDNGDFLEVKRDFARSIVCAYARIDGWAVGIVANNPLFAAGAVEPSGMQKLLRFGQVCNRYNIPLIFLQDQPGVMVGPDVEAQGVFSQVQRLSAGLRRLTTPIITVLVRKNYGFSYMLLGSRWTGGDSVVAWPSASISLAGPEAGIATVLANEERAGTLTDERRAEVLQAYLDEAQAKHAAHDGRLDDIIEPDQTRRHISRQLAVFARRRPDTITAAKPGVDP